MAAHCKPFTLVLLACLFSLVVAARADNVSITGSANFGTDVADFSVTAGSFSASSSAPGATGTFAMGSFNMPQTLNWGAGAYSGQAFAYVKLGTQFTDVLGGGLSFQSIFTVPESALLIGYFTAPVTVTGSLQAFQDLTLGQYSYVQGPLMATLGFSATGMGTFYIEDVGQGLFAITEASITFTGNGTLNTVVPEPGSILLMGTGLSSLLGLSRFKRLFAS